MNFSIYSGGKKIKDPIFLERFSRDEIGIFESLRTYGRNIFRLEEHLQRFKESAKTAGLNEPSSIPQLRREVVAAYRSFLKKSNPAQEDLFLRMTLWQGQLFVMIGARRHSETLYQKGITLQTSPVKRSPSHAAPAQAKTSDYMNAVMATLEPKPESVYEWLLLDPLGYVTEVRIGNFFMIKNGIFLTPPTTGILNGVTRRFVIECARDLEISVKEVPITRHEIYNADEAFLTNTSWEVLPVRALDGRSIGKIVPGPITLKLHQTFKQKALRECR